MQGGFKVQAPHALLNFTFAHMGTQIYIHKFVFLHFSGQIRKKVLKKQDVIFFTRDRGMLKIIGTYTYIDGYTIERRFSESIVIQGHSDNRTYPENLVFRVLTPLVHMFFTYKQVKQVMKYFILHFIDPKYTKTSFQCNYVGRYENVRNNNM